MRRALLLFVVVLLAACQDTTGPCTEWTSVTTPSEEKDALGQPVSWNTVQTCTQWL